MSYAVKMVPVDPPVSFRLAKAERLLGEAHQALLDARYDARDEPAEHGRITVLANRLDDIISDL